MARKKRTVTEYRNYFLPLQFPVLLLAGDYWKISDVPSGRLHFHNCLEIGVCHSDSGSLEILGSPLPFQAGDVTVIPRNIPHTTYSTPGTESHWSYLFLEPQELFRNIIPGTWKNFDLSLCAQRDFQAVYSREAYPQIYQLATSAIREMGERKPGYQLSAKGLLLSLYIEIIRILTAEQNGGGHGFTGSAESTAAV